jgi:pimeloyl-ACP methyl ester carboxylesterase
MAVIDGTGAWSNARYAHQMARSFCAQLGTLPGAHYERGPSGEGYRIRERAERAVNFLLKQQGKRLMLAGYSRGGSIAVMAAAMLKSKGHRIELLLLFDPVDKHCSGDTSVIPGNVAEAWVVRRQIGAPEMDKYDYTLLGESQPSTQLVWHDSDRSGARCQSVQPDLHWFTWGPWWRFEACRRGRSMPKRRGSGISGAIGKVTGACHRGQSMPKRRGCIHKSGSRQQSCRADAPLIPSI